VCPARTSSGSSAAQPDAQESCETNTDSSSDDQLKRSARRLATALSEFAERGGVCQGFDDELTQELNHRHVEFNGTYLERAVQVRG
jgi:hypothetical protein